VPARIVDCSPTNNDSFTDAGPASITVTFSKSVQPASVNKSSFTVQEAQASGPLDGTVVYQDATLTATFRPSATIGRGAYTITVRGSGSSPVVDVDNLALDGEFNGT